jgi:hypothetical protein
VADAERFAGEGVHDGEVGAAVIGKHSLDLDAVASVEGDSSLQEADRGGRFLVG